MGERQLEHPQRAARLLGAVETACAETGYSLETTEHADYERIATTVHAVLGELDFEAQKLEGQAMTLDEAAIYALQHDSAHVN